MAVINIGSGSVKLFLSGTGKTESKVTLFSAFSDKGDRTAFDLTFDAVSLFYRHALKQGESVYIFGTEAMRAAGGEMRDKIQRELDCPVEIISGETEALCGFLGATEANPASKDNADYESSDEQGFGNVNVVKQNLKPPPINRKGGQMQDKSNGNWTAVIDVGGASTEVSAGYKRPDICLSLTLGSAALFNRSEVIKSDNIQGFLKDLFSHIDGAINVLSNYDFKRVSEIRLIGGGAHTLAAILANQRVFDAKALSGYQIHAALIPAVIEEFFGLTVDERVRKYPFIEPKRALVFPYGMSIIYRILQLLPQKRAVISGGGLIEGYLMLKAKE